MLLVLGEARARTGLGPFKKEVDAEDDAKLGALPVSMEDAGSCDLP